MDEQTVEFDDADDPSIRLTYPDGEEVFEGNWEDSGQVGIGWVVCSRDHHGHHARP